MAIFEKPEMRVVKAGEELPIKLTFEGIGKKLEDLIAEKLNAHETGEHILTCAEIHDLASTYAELCKVMVDDPFDWSSFGNEDPAKYEANKDACIHE